MDVGRLKREMMDRISPMTGREGLPEKRAPPLRIMKLLKLLDSLPVMSSSLPQFLRRQSLRMNAVQHGLIIALRALGLKRRLASSEIPVKPCAKTTVP
ncbi:MAG: hypothetical protein DME24_13360 [Verrucomicrobia bacterium]|nr:MAG: hypothetical protein DME24_13360 [Verrucomicrobiota bacterium]